MAAPRSFLDYFNGALLNQMQAPPTSPEGDMDQAYGANMVPRSNLLNPNPSRDAFNALFGGTSDWLDTLGSKLPGAMVSAFVPQGLGMVGQRLGGTTGANVGNLVGSLGSAALQGFENPGADLGALTGFAKLFRGFM